MLLARPLARGAWTLSGISGHSSRFLSSVACPPAVFQGHVVRLLMLLDRAAEGRWPRMLASVLAPCWPVPS